MLEIFVKTLTSFIDKNLSALLLGAAGMILLMFQYWKIPQKWEEYNELQKKIDSRLQKIENRQRRIFDYFVYALEGKSPTGTNKQLPTQDFDSSEFDK